MNEPSNVCAPFSRDPTRESEAAKAENSKLETRNSKLETEKTSPHRSLILLLLLCPAFHLLIYGPTIAVATFLGDDWFHVQRVPPDRIPHLFYGDWYQGYRHVGGFYRPLPRLLMQLGRAAFDTWTPPYLLLPAVFHLLNCALILLIVTRLVERKRAAWAAAVVFAVYPTHSEALLQISTLADSMATTGCLLALAGYLRVRASATPGGKIAVGVGIALGALSKESWATLPLMALLLEWVWRPDPWRLFPDVKALRRVAVLVLVALFYVVFRHIVLGGTGGYGLELTARAVRRTFDGAFRVVVFPYSELALWRDLVNVYTLLGGMVLVWAVAGFPRLLLFGMGWMILATLPFLTLVPNLNDGGRMLYMVVVGWAMFVGGTFDSLVSARKTERARRATALALAVAVACPLLIAQQVTMASWRRSFAVNRRLVEAMVEVAAEQPPQQQYAILSWTPYFRRAPSNRLETAARALSLLADVEPRRVDPLLPTDATTGTVTFAVSRDERLRVGRIARVEKWTWAGDDLERWYPSANMRLVHARSDGSRDYTVQGREDGLLSPAIGGATGYYSVLIRYWASGRTAGLVSWSPPGEWFDGSRVTTLRYLDRPDNDTWLANPGWLSGLQAVFFLPAIADGRINVRRIEIARFDIAPLSKTK